MRLNRRLVTVLLAIALMIVPALAFAGFYCYYQRISPDQVRYCWFDSSGWDLSRCDIVNE